MAMCADIGQNLKSFTGNGGASIWVKNSRMGRENPKQTKKTPDKQTNKQTDNVHNTYLYSFTSVSYFKGSIDISSESLAHIIFNKRLRWCWFIDENFG